MEPNVFGKAPAATGTASTLIVAALLDQLIVRGVLSAADVLAMLTEIKSQLAAQASHPQFTGAAEIVADLARKYI